MSSPTIPCPSCGKPTGGKFCRHCGASVGADRCQKCGSPLAASSRFCSQCGTTVAAGPRPVARNERVLWFLAGGGLVLLLGGGALALSRGASPPAAAAATAEAPFAGGAGGGEAPPDISSMSPRERFDRLFDRIMRAAESGDANTVTTFAPMAVQAYAMLDTVDADARYHLALIDLHTGDVEGARAQGDSILKTAPGHLFGYIIKGTIARFQKDDKTLASSYAGYLSHYDKEMAAKRPEYAAHQRALDEFTKMARGAKGESGS